MSKKAMYYSHYILPMRQYTLRWLLMLGWPDIQCLQKYMYIYNKWQEVHTRSTLW